MSRLPRHFFTADNMFGCEVTADTRGFPSVDDMDKAMVERWNDVVGEDDLVWILGDFHAVMPPMPGLLRELHGTKYLVAGPMDRVFPPHALDPKRLAERVAYYREIGFKGVITGTGVARKTGRPLVLPLRPRRDMPSRPVILSHFPYDLTEHEEGGLDRFGTWRPKRPRGGGAPWLLHGHNADWVVNERQVNVGADAWSFEPVGAEMVEALIEDAE
jgi:calcineurin-like phosphoesterase family protein